MFGVKRWGGNGVQEVDQEGAQARLEAWKKKAKEREKLREVQRESSGPPAVNYVAPKHPSTHAPGDGANRRKILKGESNREANQHGKLLLSQSHWKHDGSVARASPHKSTNSASTSADFPSPKSPHGAAKKAQKFSNGLVVDGKSGALYEPPKPAKQASSRKAAAAEKQIAKKAIELARAERRELKRQKEVERAYDIIAKKARKAGKGAAPILQSDNVPEQDKELTKEERKELKRQKRDERSRRKEPGGSTAEFLADSDGHRTTTTVETGLAADVPPNRDLAGRTSERSSDGAEASHPVMMDEEPQEKFKHRKRKHGCAENLSASMKQESAGDGGAVEGGEQQKRRKQKAASPEETAEVPDPSPLPAASEFPKEGSADAEDAPPQIGQEVGAGPARAPDPLPTKGPPLLPWMRAPIEIGEDEGLELSLVPGLDGRLRGALEKAGIGELFPVQAAVWKEMVASGSEDHDLCVCAPTGSGKTFSYALPVCQGLSARIVRRLRALVVLPTRDLASQVKAVFDLLTPSLGLAVGLAVGQTSLAGEAQQLVAAGRHTLRRFTPESSSTAAESNVDILVCTPGRLMDHVHDTPGFTLQHLRYLVVDETDRLLRQAYQDWLPIVLSAASSPDTPGHVSTIRRPVLERGHRTPVPRVVKLVLSATLTRDPAKIQQLQLHRPLYIATSATDHRYKVPSQLQEFRLVCTAGEKPLYLIALLRQLKGQRTIVFTASVEATHRLFTLLQAFEGLPVTAGEYSSLQSQKARSATLEAFRRGDVDMLVSSDAMTRGMDVENVENVISYDAPVYAKTYVHRAGRTARAGRPGRCFTLLRKEEVRHFKGLLRKVDNNYCPDYPLPPAAAEELVPFYTAALEKLKETVAVESAGGGGTR